MQNFSSLDPTKTCNEFLKQKFFELRSFAPDAAAFTSFVQPGSHEISDVSSGNETDSADEKDVDVNPIPEPLSLLFDRPLVDESKVDIRRISKLRSDNYVKIFRPCHCSNLLNMTKLKSSNTVTT